MLEFMNDDSACLMDRRPPMDRLSSVIGEGDGRAALAFRGQPLCAYGLAHLMAPRFRPARASDEPLGSVGDQQACFKLRARELALVWLKTFQRDILHSNTGHLTSARALNASARYLSRAPHYIFGMNTL